MYAAPAPSRASAHVERSSQSNAGVPEREPIRTGTPRAVRRSATRRPVLPVPPVIRVKGWVVVVMDRSQLRLGETVHSCSAQVHTRASRVAGMDAVAGLL